MRTEYLVLSGGTEDKAKLAHAAQVLREGGLAAFPTESVYAVGADANNRDALVRLARILGNLESKPYSLLVGSARQAQELAHFSRIANKLARHFWPGPLTMALPRRTGVDTSSAGGSVTLRVPEHPVARGLLAHCHMPLAVARASRIGAPDPFTATQVRDGLNGEIALILDAGPSNHHGAPTLVRVSEDTLDVQAPAGSIAEAAILQTAAPTALFVCTGNTCRSPMAAGFCRALVADAVHTDELPFRVLSAGIDVAPRSKVHPLAVMAMKEVHIDISGHKVTGLTPELIDTADWIFTMTRAHRDCILDLMPESFERVQLLSKRGDEIPEPGGYSLERYRQVRDTLNGCLREVVRFVRIGGR